MYMCISLLTRHDELACRQAHGAYRYNMRTSLTLPGVRVLEYLQGSTFSSGTSYHLICLPAASCFFFLRFSLLSDALARLRICLGIPSLAVCICHCLASMKKFPVRPVSNLYSH